VAVNVRCRDLIAWAKERGLFIRVDRATSWANPFVLGRDGDRTTVIARYRDDYLPSRPPSCRARLLSRRRRHGAWGLDWTTVDGCR